MEADGWECWGELTIIGNVSVGKTRYREEVWELPQPISTVPAPRAFLFVSELGRQDVTGRGAWHCSQPVSPGGTASSDGCWTASSREPLRHAQGRGVMEERVGGEKKRMGEADIFSSDEKLWLVSQAREGLCKTSQPASCFFSGFEGKILQRLPCFRTRLQGMALLALDCMEKSTISHHSLSLSLCFFLR